MSVISVYKTTNYAFYHLQVINQEIHHKIKYFMAKMVVVITGVSSIFMCILGPLIQRNVSTNSYLS